MPTQVMHLLRPKEEANVAKWVAVLFTVTAISGLLGLGIFFLNPISVFPVVVWVMAPFNVRVTFVSGPVILLVIQFALAPCWALILVRQAALKRWACLTAAIIAWFIGFQFVFAAGINLVVDGWNNPRIRNAQDLLAILPREAMIMGVLAMVTAVAMTAALVVGWKDLKRGF